MNFKALIKLMFLSLLTACATQHEMEARQFRLSAFELNEKRQYDLAIINAKKGLKRAQSISVITQELIEIYDDLGLYYYQKNDYESSVYYQSVATILAFYSSPNDQSNKVFLQRLGWAYSKHKPGFNFSEISRAPLVLVCEKVNLSLHENYDIKRFLYRASPIFSNKYKYRRYRLKTDVCSR